MFVKRYFEYHDSYVCIKCNGEYAIGWSVGINMLDSAVNLWGFLKMAIGWSIIEYWPVI